MTIIAADSVGRKNKPMTELEAYLPFWGKLIPGQREQLRASAVRRVFEQGDNVRRGPEHCIGLLMVCSGQLRVYITSDSGREVTLYRLFERDICLLSASCMMPNIQFEVSVQAWERTEVVVIPAAVYQELAKTSLPVAAYTSDLMAARLSDVMWLLDQVMNKSFDSRLAAFLLEEAGENMVLQRTHEEIARYLGSAREVVTRMLRYFQDEGAVSLSRGVVHIRDAALLKRYARESLR